MLNRSVDKLLLTKVTQRIRVRFVVGISRAGRDDQYQQDNDPNRLMLRETGAGVGAETMQKALSKDREYERILSQLRTEFSRIDINKDGTISIDEIIRFLNEQTNGTVDTGIAEQIFAELDDDGSGTILLEEFIQNYFDRQRLIKERIAQIEEDNKLHYESRDKLI